MATKQKTLIGGETVSLAEWDAHFRKTLLQPETAVEAHLAMYRRVQASQAALEVELKKLTKDKLERLTGMTGRNERKPELVARALRYTLKRFALGEDTSVPSAERYIIGTGSSADYRAEEAKRDAARLARITEVVESLTDDHLAEFRREVQEANDAYAEQQAALKKAIENPETLEEFETCVWKRGIAKLVADKTPVPRKEAEQRAFIRQTGEKELTDDELTRYDELRAQKRQEARAQDMINRSTIKRVDLGEGNYAEIIQTWHSKHQCDVWLVVLAEREDVETFIELCDNARRLRGNYSRAWGDRPGGFQFREEAQAGKFVESLHRDVFDLSRLERLVARRDRVRDNAATHFNTLAGRMEDRAHESLTQPRLLNTDRRIVQAERARDAANETLAMASTLRNTAIALQQRLLTHTDRIRWRTHAEALDRLLQRADRKMARVEYPWPSVPKHALLTIAEQIGSRDGSIRVSAKIVKMCRETSGHMVDFVGDRAADVLRHFYSRARLHRVKGYYLDYLREAMGDFKRLRLLNLDTLFELRAALREHIGVKVFNQEMTLAEKVMNDLFTGRFPPDYFPTPRDVVEIMLDYAQMEDGMTWLEPEAGGGHIVSVVQELYPSARPILVELSGLLVRALEAQQYAPVHTDFLRLTGNWCLPASEGGFDRIIMNPPFGVEGVGTDIDHVLHAYPMLNPLGRLVSIMSEGTFYRMDDKTVNFREWLDSVKGQDFPLPEGAFLNSDRPTSWATRVVVIDKTPVEVEGELPEAAAAA